MCSLMADFECGDKFHKTKLPIHKWNPFDKHANNNAVGPESETHFKN